MNYANIKYDDIANGPGVRTSLFVSGCTHACKYCYASFMKRFTGHTEEWGTFLDVKHWPEIKNPKKYAGQRVRLSTIKLPPIPLGSPAFNLVMYLTSEKVQKRRAIEGAYNPTYPALYKDKEVLAANPFFGTLYDVLPNAVSRPSSITGPKYDAVSQAFWSAVHDVLNGRAKGAEAVKKLQERLGEVKKDQWQERAEP